MLTTEIETIILCSDDPDVERLLHENGIMFEKITKIVQEEGEK